MTKIKSIDSLADWLTEKIDPEDAETLVAFRTWMRSGRTKSFQCYVAMDAWSELLESGNDVTRH
jgi:hypothetical protein